MLRVRCFPQFLSVSLVAVSALAVVVRPARAEHTGALSEVPLPGGLRAALTAIDDRVAPDRSQFLLEFIRRTYQVHAGGKHDQREAALRALLVHLDTAAQAAATATPAQTLPLPLSPAIWIDVVFGGRSTPQTLVSDIVRARGPALLYYGLLSLDDETRAWLATRPELIREIAAQHAAGFVAAAPGLRVAGGSVRVPGGEQAQPAWEALVGRRLSDPVEFVRVVVADRERRLSYFLSAIAQLTSAEAAYALNLHGLETARIEAMRRLHSVFERLAPGWRIDDRTFWRPAADPALLMGELAADANGRPILPGTQRFWTAALLEAENHREEDPRALAEGSAVDFAWLCEQVFSGDQRRRYPAVLFASRVVRQISAETAVDALEAIRAVPRFPALVSALERANVRDVSVYATAARRAARLSAIDDDDRAARSLAQFQGALFVLTRAALRGGVPADTLPALVSSLAAVELGSRGDYEGRLVRWLDTLLREVPDALEPDETGAGPIERALLQILSGPPAAASQVVEWEGTRYRVDFRHAEAMRIARMLGDDSRPHLSSARALLDVADAIDAPDLTRERLTRALDAVRQVADAVGGGFSTALQRHARETNVRAAGRLAAALRSVADAMCADGLLEFTYAVALGHPDRAAISAADAAGRHDFGLGLGAIRRVAPWRLPAAGSGVDREWRVTGSLLGLDVKLADLSLVAVSSKPPLRRPTVMDEDRRVFIEAVALAEPAALTDDDRDTIVRALGTARSRLAAVRAAADVGALADEIRLSSARRNLLAWAAAYDREALANFLSHGELLALGLANGSSAATLQAWGAPAEPRVGCLCLQLFGRRPLESIEGRWNAGILASAFPDLNLRVAELLAELRMPAMLLPGVLASAMLDFINTADCRDYDDRRGLVEFVRGLRPDRIEQYLALLTSDGPLVPISEDVSEVAR